MKKSLCIIRISAIIIVELCMCQFSMGRTLGELAKSEQESTSVRPTMLPERVDDVSENDRQGRLGFNWNAPANWKIGYAYKSEHESSGGGANLSTGFYCGFSGDYVKFPHMFSINFGFANTVHYASDDDYSILEWYIHLPILMKKTIIPSSNIYLSAGPDIVICLKSEDEIGGQYKRNNIKENDKNRYDLRLALCGGGKFSKSIGWEIGYDIGLLNQYTGDNDFSVRDHMFHACLTVQF